MRFVPGQHVHLIGVGGAGLSAIARILLEKGCKVSGSDRSRNALTDALARDGATIYQGHDASYVNGADCVIVTSAARADHVEVAAARAQNIPVYKRADIMAALMEGKTVIAVAGTHGKTTTTAMIVHILRECGKDPSYIVGGVMRNTGTNAGVGKGEYFVVEADEYDNMFLGLRPDMAIVTNVEYDHPDFFMTREEMIDSFRRFVNLLENDGWLFVCADNPGALQLSTDYDRRARIVVPYGSGTFFQATDIQADTGGTTFTFNLKVKHGFGLPVHLPLSGIHNVQNALAALVVALFIFDPVFNPNDARIEECIAALNSFQGTGRRFELRGEIDGVAVIDDYAHHPTAIKVTLEAARQRYPDRQIWAVWQPHTYSRTQALMNEYVRAFDAADHVLVTDIYAARENSIPGVTSAAVVAKMQHPDARHTLSFEETVKVLDEEVQAPAVILIMSAGDAPAIGEGYLKRRQERHANPAG
jgi:UDP-N-acetylmuramate--alanine ligase